MVVVRNMETGRFCDQSRLGDLQDPVVRCVSACYDRDPVDRRYNTADDTVFTDHRYLYGSERTVWKKNVTDMKTEEEKTMDDRYDRNYEKERREAIEAGQRALNSLRAAQKELESARNWGMVDLFGGGFISSMLKQGKMNTAQNHMEQARYDLQNFSKELRDVERGVDLHINTADFLTFADWFFDGFAVDWMVQNRINRAREQVGEAIRRVERILSALEMEWTERR